MSKKLFTIGYGNDAPDVFLKRLKVIAATIVVDVRRDQTRSWCAKYSGGHGGGMHKLLEEAGMKYKSCPGLSNKYDMLMGYKAWIDTPDGAGFVEYLASVIRDEWSGSAERVVILCSEKNVWAAGLVNCHRVYVAAALVKILGEDWAITHL